MEYPSDSGTSHTFPEGAVKQGFINNGDTLTPPSLQDFPYKAQYQFTHFSVFFVHSGAYLSLSLY